MTATGANGPSFEARKKERAPQADGVRGVFSVPPMLRSAPNRRCAASSGAAWCAEDTAAEIAFSSSA
jgi:hypothetical protein